jgi:hypothetical protein
MRYRMLYQGMKRKVPRGTPRIFPLVRHGNDVLIHHVTPLCVARSGHSMFVQPNSQVVSIVLFRPQHPRKCLAHHVGFIGRKIRRRDRTTELVGFLPALGENTIRKNTGGQIAAGRRAQAETDRPRGSRRDAVYIEYRRLCSHLRGIHCVRFSVNHIFVKGIFHKGRRVGLTEELFQIRRIVSK